MVHLPLFLAKRMGAGLISKAARGVFVFICAVAAFVLVAGKFILTDDQRDESMPIMPKLHGSHAIAGRYFLGMFLTMLIGFLLNDCKELHQAANKHRYAIAAVTITVSCALLFKYDTIFKYGTPEQPQPVSESHHVGAANVRVCAVASCVCPKRKQAPRPSRFSQSFPFRNPPTVATSLDVIEKDWVSVRSSVSEVEADLNCPAIPYDSKLPRIPTVVTNGPILAWFDESLGEAATLFFNPECIGKVYTRQAMDNDWTHLYTRPSSKARTSAPNSPQEFMNYLSLGFLLGDLLCGDVYAWITCEDMGSQLLVPPPLIPNSHNISATKSSASEVAPETRAQPSSSPIVDTFISVLIDALAREKMPYVLPILTEFLKNADKDSACTHFAVPLRRYIAVGGNSPPNKLPLYAGTTIEEFKRGGQIDWLMDVAADAGFAVAWFDEGIDNFDNTRKGTPWTPSYQQSYLGDMQYWYSQRPGKVIGDWAWPTAAQGENLFLSRDSNAHNATLSYPGLSAPHLCKIDGPEKAYPSSLFAPARTPACPGNMVVHEHGIKYIDSFLRLNKGKRRAGFMSLLEVHNYGKAFPDLDKHLAETLRRWTREGSEVDMGNSSIFVWGDHGMHYGYESMSDSGRSARMQPAGWILLPKVWAVENPDMYHALVSNAASKVSHFDMHMTLRNIITGSGQAPPPPSENPEKNEAVVTRLMKERAVQSLLSPFKNPKRTCSDAGVPPECCPCHIEKCKGFFASDKAIKERLKAVAKKVNRNFAEVGVDGICTPLIAEDRSAFDEDSHPGESGCVKNEESGSIDLSIFVKQKNWDWKWRVDLTEVVRCKIIPPEGESCTTAELPDAFDDAFFGGPNATTEEACAMRAADWQGACKYSKPPTWSFSASSKVRDITSESLWGHHFETCVPLFLKKFSMKSKAELLDRTKVSKVRQFCYCGAPLTADCAQGYVKKEGDIAGFGYAPEMKKTGIATSKECAKLCEQDEICKSYEYSLLESICNLNNKAMPDQGSHNYKDFAFCASARELDCAQGYVKKEGDIAGFGYAPGMKKTGIATSKECAKLCEQDEICKSYEYSLLESICNLNNKAMPDQGSHNYKDFAFCASAREL